MGAFTGTLNSNEIFSSLYNLIISQQVFADNVKGTYGDIMEMSRVDGSLYGDTKLYYATDALKSSAWGNDSEASNLLSLARPAAPSCQAITLNVFRKIALTVDYYLSKRAWSTEAAFSQFTSVMLGWMRETKKIYDTTTFNAFLGTDYTEIGKQSVMVSYPTGDTLEESARLTAQNIAKAVADIIADMKDINRKYNDYQYLRSYTTDELMVIWNIDWVNKFTKLDIPTIFHKEIFGSDPFKYQLPARYFGTVNTVSKTTSDADTRLLKESDYGLSGHGFAGDAPGSGISLVTGGAITVPSYQVNPNAVCKIIHKNSLPYMSAFEVGTSFFNPLSLTENHYLIWGHNTLEHLKNYPMVSVNAQKGIDLNFDGLKVEATEGVAIGDIKLEQFIKNVPASGTLGFTVSGLPSGVTYTSGTKTISGTPATGLGGSKGHYRVTVTATITPGIGSNITYLPANTDTATFIIDVAAAS